MMEDLASFIQTLSEKYGLLDFGGSKVDSTAANHFEQENSPTTAVRQASINQENGDCLDVDTSWECLTTFLNKLELERSNMYDFPRKKFPTSKQKEPNDLLFGQGAEDVEEEQTLNQPETFSPDRAASFANTLQTSDLIQNASFLDELQNPSLSEDLQSTGMTKGRDSFDENYHHSWQSSPLQEFLAIDGEKDVDVLEFAKEMKLSSCNEFPQKEDAAWHASNAWFQEFCSTRNNVSTSLSQISVRAETKIANEVCLDRGLSTHDIVLSKEILLSSGSSSSPAGTEIDGQAEDSHSAAASQCGAGTAADRSRCNSPEGYASGIEGIKRGRKKAAIVSARVEKMLEESGSQYEGAAHKSAENACGNPKNMVKREDFNSEDAGKMSEFRFGMSENGNSGSQKQRTTETDEGSSQLLTQLNRSRSLLSPSFRPSSCRSRSSALEKSESRRQALQAERFSEEVGERCGENGDLYLRQMDGGGINVTSRHCLGRVSPPHQHELLKGASSRREGNFGPDDRDSATQEDDLGQGIKKSSSYDSGQRRLSSKNHAEIDYQPSKASSVDQVDENSRRGNLLRDRPLGRKIRMHFPKSKRISDPYDTRNSGEQDLPEDQEGILNHMVKLNQEKQDRNRGSLAVSPRHEKIHDCEEVGHGEESERGLARCSFKHPGQNHQNEESMCTRSRDCCKVTSSWGQEWTEVEEEIVETTDLAPCRAFVDHTKWEKVNNLLCQNGFSTIRSSNIPTSDFEEDCFRVLSKLVNYYERREQFVQALLEEGDGLRQSEERSLINIQQLESERDEIQQKLKVSERRAEVAAKAAERNHALLRRDCQKLESSNANLMQRCSCNSCCFNLRLLGYGSNNSQLEHACRAKERTLQKLQDKMRESMLKEDRHRINDKEVYEKLKHKVASAQHTNGEVLESNFLQRDLKPAQIVGIYERQKVALETEISNLRAENAKLCREICEKENIILHKVLGTKETKEALELLSRKQQMQVDEKDKEIHRLEEELKERPTMEEVEETIRSATCQEENLGQLHDRDQGESYFEKILGEICKLLELDDPSFIVETLESLLVLVSAVPRMEQFVTDVCDVVFCDGQNWSQLSNEDSGVDRTPEAVPDILKSWLQKLEESTKSSESFDLLTFKENIISMLLKRSDENSELDPGIDNRVVIGCIKNLIDVEKDYLTTKSSYSDADAIINSEPQKLLHRVIAHFQMLFEVPKLEGVMAVMNTVYIKCTEYHNFAIALSSMLGLDKEEGPNTIISAVNSILSREGM
uniref:Centrosomal protein of 70 kDa n=1 Tax=Physcomitrium patens TaxID=3218 RepID=A0A7I4CIW0_PHYPA